MSNFFSPFFICSKKRREGRRVKEGFIALFDSGIGGLTLLAECVRRYPQGRYLYCGDNENAPYGGREEREILRLARAAFSRIRAFPVRAACIACNTVTAVCIDALRKELPFPVAGTEPALRPAVRAVPGGRVLLLATRATLNSGRVGRLIASCGGAEIVTFCPGGLAGEIERNIADLSRVRLTLPVGKFDAAVLGCTHYIWVRERIAAALDCPVFDGNTGTADHLATLANICSKNMKKTNKNSPLFIGNSAKSNKKAYSLLI